MAVISKGFQAGASEGSIPGYGQGIYLLVASQSYPTPRCQKDTSLVPWTASPPESPGQGKTPYALGLPSRDP